MCIDVQLDARTSSEVIQLESCKRRSALLTASSTTCLRVLWLSEHVKFEAMRLYIKQQSRLLVLGRRRSGLQISVITAPPKQINSSASFATSTNVKTSNCNYHQKTAAA